MDYFFLDLDENSTMSTPTPTMTANDAVTKFDYLVFLTFTVGFWIGSIVANMCGKCVLVNPDKLKINDLHDKIEELEEVLDTVTTDNDTLGEDNRDLKTENGFLIAERAAHERLIKKLQDEVQRMDHKIIGLESDAYAYEAELAEFYNTARRKRLLTPTNSPPPLIRKRHRSDSELDL